MCAALTIPALFLPSQPTPGAGLIGGSSGGTDIEQPHQSIGSRCLNNLASKLLQALFPPNAAFFRLSPGSKVQAELEAAGKEEDKRRVETALVGLEQLILAYIEHKQIRVTISEALKQLIVAGNALIFLQPDGRGVKLYRLGQYVVRRDAIGSVLELITWDSIAYSALSPQHKALVKNPPSSGEDRAVDLYTRVYLDHSDSGLYRTHQEIDDSIVPESIGTYPVHSSPWLPLRMVKTDGESYGRSYVEEYIGDLREAEAVSKAIGELVAIDAFTVHMVNPAGITRIKALQKAKSGDFIPGRPGDIEPYNAQKQNSIQIAMAYLKTIEERLGYAFLLNSAVQREGERVTAEEIRYAAGELEAGLGGIYSILTQELQLPLVRRLLAQLQSAGIIAPLPEGSVSTEITTGMEALGRSSDLMKLQHFLGLIGSLPDLMQRIKPEGVLESAANSLGLRAKDYIKSEEEMQQEMEQQQALLAVQNAMQSRAQQQPQ
nr:MAG TPA: Head to tail joining protein [Caudoviricetes sp.]